MNFTNIQFLLISIGTPVTSLQPEGPGYGSQNTRPAVGPTGGKYL